MIVIGILLEVLAAALGTTSKQLIAYSEHARKRWVFHLGASINIFVGPVIDASAYAFAPQVVIAPFACLDVIFNALTAPYTLHWQHERLTRVHVVGTGLVALGAVFTAVFGSVKDDVLTVYELEAQLLKRNSLLYLASELFLIITINVLLRARLLSAMARGICLGVIAGVLMGNVFCMKGFIGIVRTTIANGDVDPWLRPTPYILIAAAGGGAVLGHVFMRKGLGEYKGIFMVTIFEGAHITAACLSGILVMEEMAHAPWSFHIAQSFADGEPMELPQDAGGQHLLQGARHRGPRDDCAERDLDFEGVGLEGARAKLGVERACPKLPGDWPPCTEEAINVSPLCKPVTSDLEAGLRHMEVELQDAKAGKGDKAKRFAMGA